MGFYTEMCLLIIKTSEVFEVACAVTLINNFTYIVLVMIVGGLCSTHGRDEKCIIILSCNPENTHLGVYCRRKLPSHVHLALGLRTHMVLHSFISYVITA